MKAFNKKRKSKHQIKAKYIKRFSKYSILYKSSKSKNYINKYEIQYKIDRYCLNYSIFNNVKSRMSALEIISQNQLDFILYGTIPDYLQENKEFEEYVKRLNKERRMIISPYIKYE